MKKNRKILKVAIAMSGGLDSSVAAALLKRAGFSLIGIYMKLWSFPESIDNNLAAELRAKKVAKLLNIPFYSLDLKKEFKERVVDYFLNEYKKGFTPNPCVVCNKKIKFGLLREKSLKLGAEYIATGHYARLSKNISYSLISARDKNKDQSYFLWMLNQKQLRRVLFPIGHYTRQEIKKMAKELKLDFLLNVPKSMEICFFSRNINDFLKHFLSENPGKIVDKTGKVLGEHRGLWFYTIGQRKGIGFSGGPYYVLDKDFRNNLLIITKNKKDLKKKEIIFKDANWISGKEPILPIKVKAKIRYQTNFAGAQVRKKLKNKTYLLTFDKPQWAVTPGQSVVFYSPKTCRNCRQVLGGGIIT